MEKTGRDRGLTELSEWYPGGGQEMGDGLAVWLWRISWEETPTRPQLSLVGDWQCSPVFGQVWGLMQGKTGIGSGQCSALAVVTPRHAVHGGSFSPSQPQTGELQPSRVFS